METLRRVRWNCGFIVTLLLLLCNIGTSLQSDDSNPGIDVDEAMKDFPEECFTAREIDDKTRVFDNYQVPTSDEDDLLLKKGWYRFTGRSANSLKEGFGGPLPGNKHNAPNFCGTHFPGTLMGSHPTVEEGIVKMSVCFRRRYCFYEKFSACECKSKKTIYVRNCLRHYIYWLIPTGNSERYCTSKTRIIQRKKSNTTSNALECTQHRVVNDLSRVWNEKSEITSENLEGWVRFESKSGNEIASECRVSKTQHVSRISQPCGAKYRGWIVAAHPSVTEGRVSRRVCFSYMDRCHCEFYSNIAVRNCGTYFVYNLRQPPFQLAKYCGAPAGSRAASNDVIKPRFTTKNICNTSTHVYDIDRLWTNTDPTVSRCDATLYGGFTFGMPDLPFRMKEGCNKTDMFVIHNRCGTQLQGFMDGRHPTVSEGYVERLICFQSSKVPCECQYTNVIGVQNCNGFYAYDLKGVPKCDARFCMVALNDAGVRIDTSSQSLYGIPSNYKPRRGGVQTEQSSVGFMENPVTVTLLSIILLVLCILLIILIIAIACLMRPWYRRKQKQRAVEYEVAT